MALTYTLKFWYIKSTAPFQHHIHASQTFPGGASGPSTTLASGRLPTVYSVKGQPAYGPQSQYNRHPTQLDAVSLEQTRRSSKVSRTTAGSSASNALLKQAIANRLKPQLGERSQAQSKTSAYEGERYGYSVHEMIGENSADEEKTNEKRNLMTPNGTKLPNPALLPSESLIPSSKKGTSSSSLDEAVEQSPEKLGSNGNLPGLSDKALASSSRKDMHQRELAVTGHNAVSGQAQHHEYSTERAIHSGSISSSSDYQTSFGGEEAADVTTPEDNVSSSRRNSSIVSSIDSPHASSHKSVTFDDRVQLHEIERNEAIDSDEDEEEPTEQLTFNSYARRQFEQLSQSQFALEQEDLSEGSDFNEANVDQRFANYRASPVFMMRSGTPSSSEGSYQGSLVELTMPNQSEEDLDSPRFENTNTVVHGGVDASVQVSYNNSPLLLSRNADASTSTERLRDTPESWRRGFRGYHGSNQYDLEQAKYEHRSSFEYGQLETPPLRGAHRAPLERDGIDLTQVRRELVYVGNDAPSHAGSRSPAEERGAVRTLTEEEIRAKFLANFAKRRHDSTEEDPCDPVHTMGSRDSMVSSGSRESVVSSVSIGKEAFTHRNFLY
ncbi:unnamed protein product [Cylicocyclus nassatus]|uniref:Uncharacterized protein n=1 Tax=Cylicocyclus nassatus TaxID=53992 RepID=A0AA36MEJ1_CYLNA|nr:unnamed protein product [Cylicocyclus nassatus]